MSIYRKIKRQLAFKVPSSLLRKVKKHPVPMAAFAGCVLLLLAATIGSPKVATHELAGDIVPFEKKEMQMTGVKESIDPRDVWAAQVEQKVQASNADLRSKLEEIRETKTLEVSGLQQELQELKALLLKQQEELARRDLENNFLQSNIVSSETESGKQGITKSLGAFSREYGNKRKNIKDYITSGSFARAVLMTGVVVGTGSNTQSNPEPVMMRLTDAGIFSKGKRTDQIKEAILIGDCSGDLSSERARCRLQTISLENDKGEIIERAIQGWIVGEDGRNGIKGMVVDKSSDMLRMAMLNGVLGGMSNFLQNQSTRRIFPISPISGQQNALDGMSQLKAGVASGASDAFSKMADFVMERFNSMSPQIVIASGREVDVVFQHGVDLNGALESETISSSDGNLGVSYNNPPPPPVTAQAKGFARTMEQVNKGMQNENNGYNF